MAWFMGDRKFDVFFWEEVKKRIDEGRTVDIVHMDFNKVFE